MTRTIAIRGARTNNLANVDVDIPHHSLTVVTGVSGSGKSSLVFDTIFREGERRFLVSLSPYARRFLARLERPDADHFGALPPALAVDQRTTVANPRSTVGTWTEIWDHLRVVFAALGDVACPACGTRITSLPACDACGARFPRLSPPLFSFNSQHGACPTCNGLAVVDRIDPELLIADPARTLRQGALVPTTKSGYIVYSQVTVDVLDQVCRAHGFDVDTPWCELTPEQRDVVFNGSQRIRVPFGKHPLESRMKWTGITAKPREEGFYKGLLPTMTETLARSRNKNILRFVRSRECPDCGGSRLNTAARHVTVAGTTIAAIARMTLDEVADRLDDWQARLPDRSQRVLDRVVPGLARRLELLRGLGLGYLSLDRPAPTLAGGEAQRIRLASQVGSELHGVLYVLDEPSIGLHPTDTEKLLAMLARLRDLGNTVLCVEHDAATIRAADWLIDLGPGAGSDGGRVLYSGPSPEPGSRPPAASRTLGWLLGETRIPIPERRRPGNGALVVRGATARNLAGLDVELRLGALNVVTGVSGAGKSTLVDHVLARALLAKLHGARAEPGAHAAIDGVEHIDKIIHIDQGPIGRTPRSNPATYTGVFDHIRDRFASEPEAGARGFTKGHFSMNVAGGRCETCLGAGREVVSTHGLADVEITCDHCGGKRFHDDVLEVRHNGHDISQVLAMSVDDAALVFAGDAKISAILSAMQKLGIAYLRLGQSSTTLSGGEAQRVKLAGELARPASGHTLYVLDEPTAGLHVDDIAVLLAAVNELVEQGHTAIVIEHDLDVIKVADHVIDLGPGAGPNGGRLVFAGTPEQLAHARDSVTGRALAPALANAAPANGRIPRTGAIPDAIELVGVTTNNLAGIDVRIPHRELTVLTGISGSGKSSLAFDTLFAEARNRFADNLTTHARRFVQATGSGSLASARGLTPTIGIRQHRPPPSRRSTVATMTEIHDYLRVIYSRAGTGGPASRPSARMFSFNHHEGACGDCSGAGSRLFCDPEKLVSDPDRSLFDGAMNGHAAGRFYGDPNGQHLAILSAVGRELGVDFDRPFRELSSDARELAMFGAGEREFAVTWRYQRKARRGEHEFTSRFLGMAGYVDEEFARKSLDARGDALLPLLTEHTCETCSGTRLGLVGRTRRFGEITLPDLCRMPAAEAKDWLESIVARLDERAGAVTEQARHEVIARLDALMGLGLGYLPLERSAPTLSGGEAQRARLAAQLATGLTGITYVLDEPTVGLHPRDTEQLLARVQQLVAGGNTVIVVEHDANVQAAADHVIEMGPGAGASGGRIVYEGPPRTSRAPTIELPEVAPTETGPEIRIESASLHNLRDIDVALPTRALTVVTGVSGSGKSSLAFGVIASSLAHGTAIGCANVIAPEIDEVVRVDQEPLARTPTSSPATYLGILGKIAGVFARTDAARALELTRKHFAGKAGLCEECQGAGAIRTPMDFLPDVWNPCEACNGQRYRARVLECRYRDMTIGDVLTASVDTVRDRFGEHADVRKRLDALHDVGLGYLRVGQPANTLSGGEAQRVKLANELVAKPRGRSLFAFDEPTTGLAASDVDRLVGVLRRLTRAGHTVLVVEHDATVIAAADHVLDLGPGPGSVGGMLVYSGPPLGLLECPGSVTGLHLAKACSRP